MQSPDSLTATLPSTLTTAQPSNRSREKSALRNNTQTPEQLIQAVQALEARLLDTVDLAKSRKYAMSLLKLQPGHPQAVSALVRNLQSPQSPGVYKRIVEVFFS